MNLREGSYSTCASTYHDGEHVLNVRGGLAVCTAPISQRVTYVINDLPGLLKIQRKDCFVEAIQFIAILIRHLTAMTRV